MWDDAVRAFAALHGRVVTGWVGVAWALTGGGDDDVLAEVLLAVGGRRLLLVAGEVEPGWDGRVSFVRHDESVLVFTEPAAADAIDWRPPREPGSGAR